MLNKSGCIITINLFKRIHANGHVESSIVTKLTQMQPFYPLFLLPTNIVPKVAFQPLIHPLCLAISLGMISCTRCQIFPHHFEELLRKCTKKPVISVIDNALRKPMQSKNFFKKYFSHLCSSKSGSSNKEMIKFSELSHHHKYAILTKYLGQTSDEVHGNALPFLFWNRKGM